MKLVHISMCCPNCLELVLRQAADCSSLACAMEYERTGVLCTICDAQLSIVDARWPPSRCIYRLTLVLLLTPQLLKCHVA